MAYDTPEEILFGISKKKLRYGFGLEVGCGKVIPEIKYWPNRSAEEDLSKTVEEYEKITKDILVRAVDLGVYSLQLETELSYTATLNPAVSEEIVFRQKNILEKFHKEHGVKLGLRVTVADIRGLKRIDREEAFTKMLETFEHVCKAGADVVSIESIGGKEVFDYSLIRGDFRGILFSLGVLAPRDMKSLWKEIVKIARRHKVLPGGDTACGFANTAMKLAGGKYKKMMSHVAAAVIRAMSVPRSLVAYEEGATGPGKDCGYENVIIKAITGYPMSLEGKTSASAHSSLVGNIVAAVCDLWSNEQVENIRLFGGTGPQVFLEVLYYDTELLNKALENGYAKIIRDLLIESDKYRDPQALILSPSVAWKIGLEIIGYSGDYYKQILRASIKALQIIKNESSKLKLDSKEKKYLVKLERELAALPEDEEKLMDEALPYYSSKVSSFNPKDYGL